MAFEKLSPGSLTFLSNSYTSSETVIVLAMALGGLSTPVQQLYILTCNPGWRKLDIV